MITFCYANSSCIQNTDKVTTTSSAKYPRLHDYMYYEQIFILLRTEMQTHLLLFSFQKNYSEFSDSTLFFVHHTVETLPYVLDTHTDSHTCIMPYASVSRIVIRQNVVDALTQAHK